MARDSLLPRSDLFCQVNQRGVPVNALMLMVGLVLLMGPMVRGIAAYPMIRWPTGSFMPFNLQSLVGVGCLLGPL